MEVLVVEAEGVGSEALQAPQEHRLVADALTSRTETEVSALPIASRIAGYSLRQVSWVVAADHPKKSIVLGPGSSASALPMQRSARSIESVRPHPLAAPKSFGPPALPERPVQ